MTTLNLRRFPPMASAVPVPDTTVLAPGELGYEDATGLLKIGDGVTAWKDLPSPISQASVRHDSAPPTTLPWGVGSITWNTAPVAGENIGWVCIAAGVPGTWAPFGSIDF